MKKSKNLKKIGLNKRVISTLTIDRLQGGKTTVEPPLSTIDTSTFNSTYCAPETDERYTCGYCTVA